MAKKTYLGEPVSGNDPNQGGVSGGRPGSKGQHAHYGMNASDEEILAGMQNVNMTGQGAFGHWLMGKHLQGGNFNWSDYYEPGGANEHRIRVASMYEAQGFDSPKIKYDHMDAGENRRIREAAQYEQYLYDTLIKPRRTKPEQANELDNKNKTGNKPKRNTLLTGSAGVDPALLGKTELLGTGA